MKEYNSAMAKETTLNEVGEMLTYVVQHMATKDDIEKLENKFNTLDNKVDVMQTQVNSIERQLRETKAQVRIADLEEEVFGKVRA